MLNLHVPSEPQMWEPLLTAWWNYFQQDSVTVDQLRLALQLDQAPGAALLPDPVKIGGAEGVGSLKRSLGRRLAQLQGRVVGVYSVRDGGRDHHHQVRKWRLVRLES